MPFPDLLLLGHLAATWTMVGLIWFVQVVHYPLFAAVGADGFVGYAADHVRRTGWVVAPPMGVEGATALLLLRWRPAAVPAAWVWLGLALVGLLWLSTALLQVPRHRRLGAGFDPAVARALVVTNWLRTVAWTARGGLVLAMVSRTMG